MEELIKKFESGNYIWIHNFPEYKKEWNIKGEHGDYRQCKPIHKKHEAVLNAWLLDNDVEIEIELWNEQQGKRWETEAGFINNYCENANYRLKEKKMEDIELRQYIKEAVNSNHPV